MYRTELPRRKLYPSPAKGGSSRHHHYEEKVESYPDYYHHEKNSTRFSNHQETSKNRRGFSQSYHDLSNGKNEGTTLNFDFLLEPMDYRSYRAEERQEGVPLGMYHDEYGQEYEESSKVKRSQSFFNEGGHHRSKIDDSRKNYHLRPDRKFADNFHRSKRHTFHFPEKADFVCEDLTFSNQATTKKSNYLASRSDFHLNEDSGVMSSSFLPEQQASKVNTSTNYLHIDREIPMQSASLEAQKFKTIIFLTGQ